MTFRYLGSKVRLLDAIEENLTRIQAGSRRRVVDLFCGTGAVAWTAAKRGWPVHANDHLACAVLMATARVACEQDAPFERDFGYAPVLERWSQSPQVEGYFWRTYSPASRRFCDHERQYFTEDNAARIDGLRQQLQQWWDFGELTPLEYSVLLADLLSAANRVANIAGTYGCFMSKWQASARNPLKLQARTWGPGVSNFTSSTVDVFDVTLQEDDVVYLDPPYTKRQYAAYYHLLESLTLGDEPVVEGVCGLRPWRDKSSVFCYKIKALQALSTLMLEAPARDCLLSYSDEGHISLDDLQGLLSPHGRVIVQELAPVARYTPNVASVANRKQVREYLVSFSKH